MSAGVATLLNTCAVCGAEESLDGLLLRMIDDDQVRRLIADVITTSLPLGGLVVRYLRLHKPAKQRLRMSIVAKLLGELLPDIRRGSVERAGRSWIVYSEHWVEALQSVFEAQDKGTLVLPLLGNGYLYQCVMRIADKHEATAEQQEQERSKRRLRGNEAGVPMSMADLTAGMARLEKSPGAAAPVIDRIAQVEREHQQAAANAPLPPPPVLSTQPKIDSPLVRRMKADLAAKRGVQP